MLKIMEHKGLHIYLDSSEMEDICVVGRYRDRETMAILEVEMESLSRIRVQSSKHGRQPLPSEILLEFEDLLSLHGEEILSLWSRLVQGYSQSHGATGYFTRH